MCICQSVRVHIMHERVCRLCAQANTRLESFAQARTSAAAALATARANPWPSEFDWPCPCIGSRSPCRACTRFAHCLRRQKPSVIAGRDPAEKPGRTRGGVSGRPDRGRARYRRRGAAPSSWRGFSAARANCVPNRRGFPYAVEHRHLCTLANIQAPILVLY